ncbi:hypothetical protein IWQ54_000247 [Labrenzia sp. EL_195]|nr:hypothetical protein [Labrenzia sp. EL_195]
MHGFVSIFISCDGANHSGCPRYFVLRLKRQVPETD